MDVTDWLLEADPAIRWQVRRDLLDAPADEVAAERARVAREGWGAELLAQQADDGYWGEHEYGEDGARNSVMWTLQILRNLGSDPADPAVAEAIARVRSGVTWRYFDGRPYFSGEEEACVNGGVLANAAYFGELGPGSDEMLRRLIDEQRDDGGWNCEPDSERSSIDTTLCVLEGLLGYERAIGAGADGADPAQLDTVRAARRRGEEYLLERQLYRRRSTGEVVKQRYLDLSFPTYWWYDLLRALDYFRESSPAPDPRLADPLEVMRSQRLDDGRWPAGRPKRGHDAYEIDVPEGEPSPWNTLRALRVLRWARPDAASASEFQTR
ncbi:hypothetical protein FLP10_05060 [Agromyces intestinalis]|uniref:Squalene cyclase C-terminal domain-containing protein n=1 Tax=Agromyces intestinalis TaxID=2592652 RepID=A0A5C1YGH6_9MICO|nr:hypothetical protein [Agromyces intestinalis]QEO13862.1 hypothetical protein FLP10_05060 [Agromyces intestinalis]